MEMNGNIGNGNGTSDSSTEKLIKPSYSTFEKEKGSYTVDEAIDKCGFGKFQILVTSWSGVAWIAQGIETTILSILGPTLVCDFHISAIAQASLATIVYTGIMIGCPLFGMFADVYSRRTALIFCSALTWYFSLLSSFSPTFIWLVILRCFGGFTVSGLSQVVTYYSEFLPNVTRGKSVIFLGLFWALGGMLEVLLAMIFIPTLGWGPWLAVSTVPLLITHIMGYWMPTSPRFNLTSGRSDLAEETLQQLSNMNKKDLPDGKLKQEETESERGKFTDLLAPEVRLTTLLLWLIWVTASFGYYGIIFMSAEIINYKVECVSGLLLAGVLIDPLGRKKTMILIFSLYTISVLLLFICVNRTYIIVMLFFVRAFGSSAFQVVVLYTPEVYSTKCRSVGMGVTGAMERLGSITTPFVAIVLISYSIPIGIGVYAGIGALVTIACCFLPFETSGRDMGDLTRLID